MVGANVSESVAGSFLNLKRGAFVYTRGALESIDIVRVNQAIVLALAEFRIPRDREYYHSRSSRLSGRHGSQPSLAP